MKHTTKYITAKDGCKLFFSLWQGENEPHSVINLIHGIGEHCLRYEHVAAFFTAHGFAFHAFDLRGHGQSEGKRGHIENFEQLRTDVDLLFESSMKLFPNLPQILYGHSLGGNIALNYSIFRQPKIKKLVVTSPWLRLAFEPAKLKIAAAKIFQKILPKLSQSTNLDTKMLSQSAEVVLKYEQDPLVHGVITTRLFYEAMQSADFVINNVHKIAVPIIFAHGDNDKITSHKATQEIAEKTASKYKIWKNQFHELHNETIKNELFEFILNEIK